MRTAGIAGDVQWLLTAGRDDAHLVTAALRAEKIGDRRSFDVLSHMAVAPELIPTSRAGIRPLPGGRARARRRAAQAVADYRRARRSGCAIFFGDASFIEGGCVELARIEPAGLPQRQRVGHLNFFSIQLILDSQYNRHWVTPSLPITPSLPR